MRQIEVPKGKKMQPGPVRKLFCPNCKEVMVKIYPNSTIFPQAGMQIPPCVACQNKGFKTVGRYDGPVGDKFPTR